MSSGRPAEVDADTITLLITMLDAWRLTQGRFDPTVLPALMAVGYGASVEDPLSADDPAARRSACRRHGGNRRRSIPARGTVPAGVVVDAGGIGKGSPLT